MEENTEITAKTDKHLFQKGEDPRRNLNGRPTGTRNFETDFDEAVEEIAKENGMTRSEARKLLLKVAFKNAKEGNYSFYKDIHDRIYGQASQKIDNSGTTKVILIDKELAPLYGIRTTPETNGSSQEPSEVQGT